MHRLSTRSGKRKGQGVLMVFFAITIIALVAGLAAYAQIYKLPPAFQQEVNSLGYVTRAESRLQDTVNHFIPVAAHYGVSQAAHHWGDEKNFIYHGHGDPDPRGSYSDDSADDSDEMEYYTNLINNVDRESQLWFENYTNTLTYQDGCTVTTDDARVNLSFESQNITINATTGNPLASVECSREELDVKAETALGEKIDENMTNIRFHELASGMIKAMSEMENVSEDLEANDRHWGSRTETSACLYSESTYSNPRDRAEEAAFQDARSHVVNNVFAEIEKAIVKDNSDTWVSGSRGAKKVLNNLTHGGDICFFGFCLSEAFMDDISYRNTEVISNTTTIESTSNSTAQCGCNRYVCNQDADSEYSYSLAPAISGGSCQHIDESSVGNNPYTADCDAGEHKDGGTCYNASSGPRHSVGTPDCSEEDFEHDGSGGCELDESDSISDSSNGRPNPQCSDKVYSADAQVDYYYNSTTVQVELYDEKYNVPTNDGWQHLVLHRRYNRNFWK